MGPPERSSSACTARTGSTPRIPGLWEIVPPGEDEELWIGIDRYRSAKKCAEVAAAVDRDPEILALYERIVDLVGGAARMVHASFEEPP